MSQRNILLFAGVLIVVLLLFSSFPKPGDAGSIVYADLFVQDVKGLVTRVGGSDLFKPFATISLGNTQLYDSGSGLSGAIMVDLHAKPIIAAGTPVSWRVSITTIIKADDVEKTRSTLVREGSGVPPSDILIGRVSRSGANLAGDFGAVPAQAVYHGVSFDVSATMTIIFKEGNPWTASFTKNSIASAQLTYSPDAGAFTFSVDATATGGSAGSASPSTVLPDSSYGMFEIRRKDFPGWWVRPYFGTPYVQLNSAGIAGYKALSIGSKYQFVLVVGDPVTESGVSRVTGLVADPGPGNVIVVDQWYFPGAQTGAGYNLGPSG